MVHHTNELSILKKKNSNNNNYNNSIEKIYTFDILPILKSPNRSAIGDKPSQSRLMIDCIALINEISILNSSANTDRGLSNPPRVFPSVYAEG